MKKFGLPQCPYCGRKVNPFYAWVLRTQGEYICPSCKGVSNIVLSPLAKLLGAGAAIVGILVFVIALLDKETDLPIFYLLWIMAPFVLFSILSAFCVQLKKPILRRREAPGQQQRKPAHNASRPAQTAPAGRYAPSPDGRPYAPVRQTGAVQASRPARTAPSASQTAPRQGGAAQPRPSAYPQGSAHNASRPSSYAQAAPRVIRPGEAQNAPAGAPANTPAPRTPAQTARPKPPEDDVWTAWDFDGRDGSK